MAGSSGNKTNSAFNWVEVEAKAELGNIEGQNATIRIAYMDAKL